MDLGSCVGRCHLAHTLQRPGRHYLAAAKSENVYLTVLARPRVYLLQRCGRHCQGAALGKVQHRRYGVAPTRSYSPPQPWRLQQNCGQEWHRER